MNDQSQQLKMSSKLSAADISILSPLFPGIESVVLPVSVGEMHQLAIYLKHSNPDKHPKRIRELKSTVEQEYLNAIKKLQEEEIEEIPNMETIDQIGKIENHSPQIRKERERKKFTLSQLKQFIKRGTDINGVDPVLIEQVRSVNSWQSRQSTCVYYPMRSRQVPISLSSTNSIESQPASTTTTTTTTGSSSKITITIGANISPEAREMRLKIARQAQNNKMLTEEVSQIQQKEREVNYLLNRVTQQWYSQIEKEVGEYVLELPEMVAKKIVSKAIEQHSFIDIYCRMIEGFCKISRKQFQGIRDDFGEDRRDGKNTGRYNVFRKCLIDFMEDKFYQLTLGNYQDESNRKELLGMSLMMGRLFQVKILKKRVFAVSFQWLINRYVKEHRISAGFDHQIYIEMIIKMVEKMPTVLPSFTCQRSMIELSAQLDLFLLRAPTTTTTPPPRNAYIPLLRLLIDRYPSPRRKLGFLLQDHELTKEINKGKQENFEEEKKEIERIFMLVEGGGDGGNEGELEREMSILVRQYNPKRLMHWYLMLLPEGTIAQINKRVSLFTLPSFKEMYSYFHSAFQYLLAHFVGLDCDYPYLATALAKLMIEVGGKIEVTAQGEEGEEQRQFIDKIQMKMKGEGKQIERED